jgi:hypothetical protein
MFEAQKIIIFGSIRLSDGLDGRVPFPATARGFSLRRSVKTGSGAHQASGPMNTGLLSPGIKRPGRVADHSLPSSDKIKNGGAILPLPCCFHGVMLT